MSLHTEAVVAMGDAEQLRNRHVMRAAKFVLLSWGDRLGFKTKLPLGPAPKPRPHRNFGSVTERQQLFAGSESARRSTSFDENN